MSSPYDTNYAYRRSRDRYENYSRYGFATQDKRDSEEYIRFILDCSILPYWRKNQQIVPEAVDYLCTMSQGTFASLAYKIGIDPTLTVGESADLMNAIHALREGKPQPPPLDLDIPKFPVVEEELRGRKHIRIPRK